MRRRSLVFFLAMLLMLWMISGSVFAQDDPDGDGIFGAKDQCPNVAGPASNNGCPLPQPQQSPSDKPQEQPLHPPGDSDGDGTLDENDQCPLDGGPDWNNGCPTDLTAPPQSAPQITLPTMPAAGECVVATAGQRRVNVHTLPAVNASIVDALNPANLYPAYAMFTSDSGVWYLVGTGWVSGAVLRTGGSCDSLPGFEFSDVALNLSKGPGAGMILSFTPMPGGKPSVTLHPFADKPVSLHFTKADDAFPDAGFALLLSPFPGTPGAEPQSSPQGQGSNVFDDGFLFGQMGDGSVFILMPPTSQSGDNPLNGILIGLSQPQIDPNHILIGLSQPANLNGILIGLSQPANLNGILIGLLLPAVQTGDSNTQGILIGLLLPAVQEISGSAGSFAGFSREPFAADGGVGDASPGGGPNFPSSIQQLFGLGVNFLVPAVNAPSRNLFMAGWSVEVEGIEIPTE